MSVMLALTITVVITNELLQLVFSILKTLHARTEISSQYYSLFIAIR